MPGRLSTAMLLTGLVWPHAAFGGLSTQDMTVHTPGQLVDILVGSGVTDIRNVSLSTGTAYCMAGTFGGGADIIGFESGVILGSGNIAAIIGPNMADDTTWDFGRPGDPDLDAMVWPETTYDAAVLEFDFVPAGASVTFDYVFSSEEYNEFVYQYNDVFGFFLNGKNVALLPDGVTVVSINTVNGGTGGEFFGTDAANPEYYRNNDLDDGGGSVDTEMDGLTTILKVSAPVNAGQVNHIKLAIADTGDDCLDSNVFISAGTFSSPSHSGPGFEADAGIPSLRVFPNPFCRAGAVRGTVKFEGVEPGANVRIYTVRGLKVWEGVVETPHILEWDGTNESGKPVAPGTYIWFVETAERKEKGFLVVQ